LPFFSRVSLWLRPRNVRRLRCLPRLFLFGYIQRVS